MTNLFDLKGKKAVITGGSSGLGVQYAKALAGQGADVAVVARRIEELEKVRDELRKFGTDSIAVQCDVSKNDSIVKAVNEIIKHFGSIDILVNNAGIEIAENIEDVSEEHFNKIISVNLKGTFMMSKVISEYMKKQNQGKIINIGSLGSHIGLAGSTVYCSTKGGVISFSRALAIELAKYNIQVNTISPGYFRTSMTEAFFQDEEHNKWIKERIPLGRIGTAADLAGTVIFLASDASNYITGQNITVDGGWLAS
jgi:NAD(P)-dependent dehydrogenase (short-subunit alcohol dehydrogenase family)